MKVLRIKEVCAQTGLSRSTLLRRIAEGRFPKGKKIGSRNLGWLDSQIDQWLSENYGEAA